MSGFFIAVVFIKTINFNLLFVFFLYFKVTNLNSVFKLPARKEAMCFRCRYNDGNILSVECYTK